jgi:hypothetical protein
VKFFTGMHHPSDADKVGAAFVSVKRLLGRRRNFPVGDWIMDSGAFTEIAAHGRYTTTVGAYACEIRRWRRCGNLLAAVAQDYMCETMMLEKTGLTIANHQRLTIERYDALLACNTSGVYILPVLQGYAPADYVDHIRQYGDRLKSGMWTGVGSICKRNGDPAAIRAVLSAIKAARPDLRLHAFGVKTTALACGMIRDMLYSADSMAWSAAARRRKESPNDPRHAVRFAHRIATMPVQDHFDFGAAA